MTKSLKGYSVKHKNFLLDEIITLQQSGAEIERTKNHLAQCREDLQTVENESVKEEMRYQIQRATMELKNLYIHIIDVYDMNDIIVPEPAKTVSKPVSKPKAEPKLNKGAKTVTVAKKIEINTVLELVGTRIWFKSKKGNIQRKLELFNGQLFVEAFGDIYILEHSEGIYFEVQIVHLQTEVKAS